MFSTDNDGHTKTVNSGVESPIAERGPSRIVSIDVFAGYLTLDLDAPSAN